MFSGGWYHLYFRPTHSLLLSPTMLFLFAAVAIASFGRRRGYSHYLVVIPQLSMLSRLVHYRGEGLIDESGKYMCGRKNLRGVHSDGGSWCEKGRHPSCGKGVGARVILSCPSCGGCTGLLMLKSFYVVLPRMCQAFSRYVVFVSFPYIGIFGVVAHRCLCLF